jgi:hypothetical protein
MDKPHQKGSDKMACMLALFVQSLIYVLLHVAAPEVLLALAAASNCSIHVAVNIACM